VTWLPDDDNGGWSFDCGTVHLAVMPMDDGGPSTSVSWHVKWIGEDSEPRGHDGYERTAEHAMRQAVEFALRQLKTDRKRLLAARIP
jgi:hypothetical protein